MFNHQQKSNSEYKLIVFFFIIINDLTGIKNHGTFRVDEALVYLSGNMWIIDLALTGTAKYG